MLTDTDRYLQQFGEHLKNLRIESMVPPRYQKLFCDFAGVVGSPFYNTLKDGSRPYCRFVLRKPSDTPSADERDNK